MGVGGVVEESSSPSTDEVPMLLISEGVVDAVNGVPPLVVDDAYVLSNED
jgi:hypothetical protein